MTIYTIALADQDFEVPAIPLGRVKLLIPAINRVANGFAQPEIKQEAFENAILCISIALQKSVEEIEALPASFSQLIEAIQVITKALGLTEKGKGGEAGKPTTT